MRIKNILTKIQRGTRNATNKIDNTKNVVNLCHSNRTSSIKTLANTIY